MPPISLPAELWRKIIREATSPPVTTSWDYTPSERIFQGWEDLQFDDPANQTKVSIVLVCRQWHTLGIEFLYEWIRFRSIDQAVELTEVFRNSSGGEPVFVHPF